MCDCTGRVSYSSIYISLVTCDIPETTDPILTKLGWVMSLILRSSISNICLRGPQQMSEIIYPVFYDISSWIFVEMQFIIRNFPLLTESIGLCRCWKYWWMTTFLAHLFLSSRKPRILLEDQIYRFRSPLFSLCPWCRIVQVPKNCIICVAFNLIFKFIHYIIANNFFLFIKKKNARYIVNASEAVTLSLTFVEQQSPAVTNKTG